MLLDQSKVTARFFGVPKGFQTYPTADNPEFYKQFYADDTTNDYKLIVRQNRNVVRYIYIRYGITSHDKRKGSLFGVTLEIEGFYINNVNDELINFFHLFYKELLDDQILLKQGNKRTTFNLDSFKSNENYVNKKLTLIKRIPSLLSDNLVEVTTNLQSSGPNVVAQLNPYALDSSLNKALQQYGGFNLTENTVLSKKEDDNLTKLTGKELQYYTLVQELDKSKEERKKLELKIVQLENENKEAVKPKINDDIKKEVPKRENKTKLYLKNALLLILLLGVLGGAAYFIKEKVEKSDQFERQETQNTDSSPLDTSSVFPPRVDSLEENRDNPIKNESESDLNFRAILDKVNSYKSKNKFTNAINLLKREKQNFPNKQSEVTRIIAELNNSKNQFLSSNELNEKRKLLRDANSLVQSNQYTNAIDLLSKNVKKFNSKENKQDLVNEIAILKRNRCRFIEDSVNWYTNNGPYVVKNTQTWISKSKASGCYTEALRFKLGNHRVFSVAYNNYISTGIKPERPISEGYYKDKIKY
jgi:hypothetical protein